MYRTHTLVPSFPFTERANAIPVSFVREILKAAANPGIISFAGGLPNAAFFPAEEMAKAAAAVFRTDGRNALQYSTTEGYLPLRQYISDRYRKKHRIDIPPENILITSGSQQALDLVGKAFIEKKSPVLLEKPSYLGAIQCFSMYQPLFCDIDMEHDGISLEALEEAYWNYNAPVFYCNPNYQNPTGICYSTEKRLEMASIIRRYNTVLVEDDPYGELYFGKEQPDPVKSYNSEQVILLGSFSKTIAPGLRLGWMAADKGIMDKLVRLKQASDLHASYLSQRILYQYLQDNDWDFQINQTRTFYHRQKNLMVSFIRKYLPKYVTFNEPEGGMFMWITLPPQADSAEVLKEVMLQNVVFVPGINFYVSNGCKNTIRLNFSNMPEQEMETGIRILGEVLMRMY